MNNKKIWLAVVLALALNLANAEQVSFKQKFAGKKLTMDGAHCAGISFSKNGNEALMFGEGGPKCNSSDALALRARWLDSQTFILIEKEQLNSGLPPRTFLSKIKSVKGQEVTLTDIWTGWNKRADYDGDYILN